MTIDPPAAHSMDTCWFAVDEDGHVGAFDSGEPGVVPADWLAVPQLPWARELAGPEFTYERLEVEDLLLKEIVRAVPEVALRNPPSDNPRNWLASGQLHVVQTSEDWGDRYFVDEGDSQLAMFLTFNNPFQDDLIADRLPLQQSEVIGLLVQVLPAETYRQIHAAGNCLGCFFPDDDPGRLGLFVYDFDFGQTDYERLSTPAVPLLASDLPPKLRRYVEAVRFDTLGFTRARSIRVPDHLLCGEYDRSWTIDPMTKTVAPNSWWSNRNFLRSEYRKVYPQLKAWAQATGFRVEPPPK